jgi:hypothetical protein
MPAPLTMPHWSFLLLPSQPMYYLDGFRAELEEHLAYLRSAQDTQLIQVDPGLAYRFEYNLYALLDYMRIPKYMQWLVMRMTGLRSPDEMDRNLQYLLLPDELLVEQIRCNWATLHRTL